MKLGLRVSRSIIGMIAMRKALVRTQEISNKKSLLFFLIIKINRNLAVKNRET